MEEFENLTIPAQELKEHDIIIIDGGEYKSEVFLIASEVKSQGVVICIMGKGMFGGSDQFIFTADALVEVSRRKSQ